MCGAANLVRFGLGAGSEQYLALGRGIRTFCADQRRSSCADLVDMRCHGRTLRRDDDGELSGARAVHDFIDDVEVTNVEISPYKTASGLP